tara:strand:- start:5816 stop:6172 length:357 start_codon:yes stop_codon:yes gene_type:complete
MTTEPLSIPLTSQEKKTLRGVAHHLSPVVSVGDHGVTEGVLEEADRALREHELIKVKVHASERADRVALIDDLLVATESALVQIIGKVAVLYRRNPKPNQKLSNIWRYLETSAHPKSR